MLYNFHITYPRILKVLNSSEMKTRLHNATLNYDWTHVGKILTSDRCGHTITFFYAVSNLILLLIYVYH